MMKRKFENTSNYVIEKVLSLGNNLTKKKRMKLNMIGCIHVLTKKFNESVNVES